MMAKISNQGVEWGTGCEMMGKRMMIQIPKIQTVMN